MDTQERIRDFRKGTLAWYPFTPKMQVLFIGEQTDPLYAMLSAQEVQLEVLAGEAWEEMLAFPKQSFDAVIAIESLEYLPKIEDALAAIKDCLKPEGHFLFGVNNRFGIRYFVGDRDPYTNRNFDGIENYRRAYSRKEDTFHGKCYDKATIYNLLCKLGFRMQCYSVFSDFSNVQLLLRDDYPSKEDFATRILPTYHYPYTVFLEEQMLYRALQENGMLHTMANCLLFDATQSGEALDVLQVTSSLGRDKEDAFLTVIHEDERVEKRPFYPQGTEKIKRMLQISADLQAQDLRMVPMEWTDNRTLSMPYVDAPSGLVYLQELCVQDETRFLEEMDRFVELILQSSPHATEDAGDGEGVLLETAYPDLVPHNSFYVDGQFVFFDQEFVKKNYPANVIIYISVIGMGNALTNHRVSLTLQDLYQRYGLDKKLEKWAQLHGEFITDLRKEKELQPYFGKVRSYFNQVHSNRQRLNFSAEEYVERFVNLLKGLEQKKVILFGSGLYAKEFLQKYGNDYDIELLLDNDTKKWGTELYGHPVGGIDKLSQYEDGTYRVIICIKNFLSVMEQLEEAGVRDYGVYDPNQQYVRERFIRSTPNEPEKTSPKKYQTGYIAGVFDLFHVGHLEKFKLAKEQCEHLIVGLVSDEGVRKYKHTEPFVPFRERKVMLEACRYVDEVVEIPLDFGGTKDAWKMYQFDVQFSGSDYMDNPEWISEKENLNRHGVDIVFFPYTESTSSSKLKALIEKKLL